MTGATAGALGGSVASAARLKDKKPIIKIKMMPPSMAPRETKIFAGPRLGIHLGPDGETMTKAKALDREV